MRWWVRLMAAVMIVGSVVVGVAPAASAAPALDPAAVDRFVNDYVARTGLPGAEVAITRGDTVVHVAGYGHDSTGRRVAGTTPMPVASLSKSFTALAVMQLVERGRIDLDAPVHRYLPAFHLADERGARITVRELLNQTSGMSDTTFPDLRLAQPRTLAGAVDRLHDAPLASAPGTAFHYHNPNYQVAGRLVEAVSGEPFATYLSREIFAPLGMTDTTSVLTTAQLAGLPAGHIRAYGAALTAREPDWFLGGSAGVLTTASDLADWLIAQNHGGVGRNGHRIISAAGITAMQTPAPHADGYAMGWERQHEPGEPVKIEHNGELFTYTADQVLLPGTGYGIAVLANTGLSLTEDDAAIMDGLVALVGGHDPGSPRPGGTYADWVLAALTLLVLALGVLGVLRARRWVERRRGRATWWTVVRLVPWLLPLVILGTLRESVGFVFGGRAGGYLQIAYVWLALVVFLGAAALAGLAVPVTRLVTLLGDRRRGGTAATAG